MTSVQLNPAGWSPGAQWLIGIIGVVLMSAGTIAGGGFIQAYNFGVEREHQRGEFVTIHSDIATAGVAITKLVTSQEKLQTALSQEHEDASKAASAAATTAAAAATAAATNASDLAQGRLVNLPRIDRLEQALPPIQSKLSAIEQHLSDIESITKSHDEDIRATRNAVAPKADYSGRGH